MRSTILDSGSTLNVFNQQSRFMSYQNAAIGDFLWAADRQVPIAGYGSVDLSVSTPRGTRKIHLEDAAYCPSFICNVVSLDYLKDCGYWWDTRPESECLRRGDNSLAAEVPRIHGQYVLDYVPLDDSEGTPWATLKVRRRQTKATPIVERRAIPEPMHLWHHRLGHPNPEALRQLHVDGPGVTIKGPTTVQCDLCGRSKVRKVVDRAPRARGTRRAERIAVDRHGCNPAYDGSVSLILFTDRYTGYMWDYYVTNYTAEDLLTCIRHFTTSVRRRYHEEVEVFESDNELIQSKLIRNWLRPRGFVVEPSAPNTQAQNGGAE